MLSRQIFGHNWQVSDIVSFILSYTCLDPDIQHGINEYVVGSSS